jgi:hypothetical protein
VGFHVCIWTSHSPIATISELGSIVSSGADV